MIENSFLIAQIIGLIALIGNMAAVQIKNSRNLVLAISVCDIFWALQFLILGANAGAFLCLASFFRNSLVAFSNANSIKYIITIFLVIISILSVYSYQGLFSLIPFLATSLYTISLLKIDCRGFVCRSTLICSLLWIAYAIIVGSYPIIICYSFCIFSNIIGMARHEKWDIGKCYKTFAPSIIRSLIIRPQTYP